jgi:hypothetical protein
MAENITPISSAVSLVATADAEGTQVTNTSSMSQGNTVSPLFASVVANAVGGGTNSTAMANVFAQWNSFDPSQGLVTFSNVGWSITAGPNCNLNCGADLSKGLDYQYTFLSTANQFLNLNFDVFGSGIPNNNGLNGFTACLNTTCSTDLLNTSGSNKYFLAAGQTYTLNLKNNAAISIQGAGIYDAEMNAQFLFFTTPVPDPPSLLLFGTGLIGIAATLRKKLLG